MSRDIRSFFRPHKAQSIKLEDDDEVIPESPDVEIKVKKRDVRKKRVLSDSDEEIFSTKKKKQSDDGKKSQEKISRVKSPVKKPMKEVKVLDVFGTAPIKRSESNVQKLKKETETGIHSDDDFDKSLLELDDNAKKPTLLNSNLEMPSHTCDIKAEADLLSRKDKSPKACVAARDKKIEGGDMTMVISPLNNQKSDISSKKAEKRHHDSLNPHESVQEKSGNTRPFIETPIKLQESKNATKESNLSKKRSDKIRDSAAITKDKNALKNKSYLETSLNESAATDEERFERKRYSAALYQKYLNRSGPKNLGTKEMPEGAPNCLKDCVFLLTGVLDSFEREDVTESITKFGGTVKNSMSKKVTHVLAGDDSGPTKIAKAHEYGISILNENDFMELIINKSKEINSGHLAIQDKKNSRETLSEKSSHNRKMQRSSHDIGSSKVSSDRNDNDVIPVNTRHSDNTKDKIESIVKSESMPRSSASTKEDLNDLNSDASKHMGADLPQSSMWVDKYKPQTLKQIIGQHGEASNVKKLCNWLTKWYVNRKAKLPKPSPWAKNDDGGYYKAALLSGPPGVGKTTTVSLVCKELGFDIVEFNASDTRSKSLIKEQIGELLTTTSLSGYAKGANGKQAVTKKRVLVMDEVDGMAGNEDRGGLQELIGLIRSACVPIICMCNDRNSQKMRSLVNYCYDLRFNRPRVDQIKAAMMSVCCKEGLRVPGAVLVQLIAAARQDVRQTLHLLAVHAAAPAPPAAPALKQPYTKDIKLGPWEAIRKVFSAEEHKTMSIHDKSDLFFYDYSLAPLFVQENYLQVAPHCPQHEVLEKVSRAAEAISAGDLVDARVRGQQAWSLLPVQAMYSSVIPGHAMAGHVTGQIQFPGWLGKNSRRSKMHRLAQEIHAHTRLSTSGSKSSIFLDYCTHLRDAIVTPLVKDKADGVAPALEVLEAYHLLREDLDSLVEISLWPGQTNPMILIDSKNVRITLDLRGVPDLTPRPYQQAAAALAQIYLLTSSSFKKSSFRLAIPMVKSAMTRTYNKSAAALPYAPGAARRRPAAPGADDPGELSHDEPQDDSDPENDAFIKKKKIKENEKPSAGKEAPGPSNDKPSSRKGKSKKK